MDTKWPQEFFVKPMNEIVTNTCLKQPNPPSAGPVERKARPDQVLNCPRCNSLNTKFCYYNNYSLTQPRYFCKDCRRYWTEGGSLRNIPIGGGIRKNKRSSSSSSKKPLFVHNTPPPPLPHLNPEVPHEASKVPEFGFSHTHCEPKNLNLSFSQGFGIGHQNIPQFRMKNPPSLVSTSSALELLGISTSRPPFPMPSTSISYSAVTAPPGFGMSYPHQFQEFMRPTSLDGGGGGGGEGSIDTNNGKPLMQFESLNLPVSSPTSNSGGNDHEHDEEKETADPGFWNGMLSAGSWQ